MEHSLMLDAASILRMHDACTQAWHEPPSLMEASEDGLALTSGEQLMTLIEGQHRANFDLWHQEDEARNLDATADRIAAVKHAIDQLNQRRNDLVETVDSTLFEALVQRADVPLHSETPGMMIDRLSIMALKIFHTREETLRETATEAHREKNLFRLSVLMEQRADLAACLDELIAAIRAGERRFKIYRQMKMYNDPELNPVLYRQGAK